jgi:hypothetical protein
MAGKKRMKDLQSSKEAFGIMGLVFAIVSLLSMSSNGIIYAILGIVFSKIQEKKGRNKISRAGLIIGIIGLILNVVFVILLITYYPTLIENIQAQFPSA